MSAAVVASIRSFGCVRTASRTLSIRCIARFTAVGPVTSLGTQIEKNSASSPPSRMRGMSMLPFCWRAPMSNVLSKSSRCVVSACVSTTMARVWTSAGVVGAGGVAAGSGVAGGAGDEQATARIAAVAGISRRRECMPGIYAGSTAPCPSRRRWTAVVRCQQCRQGSVGSPLAAPAWRPTQQQVLDVGIPTPTGPLYFVGRPLNG